MEVADIFRAYGDQFINTHPVTAEQSKVLWSLQACRTAALGGHLERCDRCNHPVPSYNSCLNRHCPKCQSLKQAQWIEQRIERILPTHYFHLVFTLPGELRSLAKSNREIIFNLLFSAAQLTLKELALDKKGVQLGMTGVLHTWTRQLTFHPHLHFIVTGGGLTVDNKKWESFPDNFIFPVKVLSKLFRAKFLCGLKKLYQQGHLRWKEKSSLEPNVFYDLIEKLFEKDWVVYAKKPFASTQHVYEYLGRYTHRVAISNQRLLSMENGSVTFFTKNNHTHSLEGCEFIRRFLQHVLPKNFVKIRHFGLMASANVNTKLETAKALLDQDKPQTQPADTASPAQKKDSWVERMIALTGKDPKLCPRCKKGRMISVGPIVAARVIVSTIPTDTS